MLRDETNRLIVIHQRRLQKLREKQAFKGPDTEAHVLLEIENTEAEIARLRQELEDFEQRSQTNPYVGLHAFREENAQFFFGREDDTVQLVDKVKQQPIITVLGPSGCGKSSLVFAGLIPELRQDEKEWLIIHFRPGSDPFKGLAAALLPLFETELNKIDLMAETNKLAEHLKQQSIQLPDVVATIHEAHLEAHRLLIIIDQFEELYTHIQDRQVRHQFLNTLLGPFSGSTLSGGQSTPTRNRPIRLRLVLTLRADFLNQTLADEHQALAAALQATNLKLLTPLNEASLGEAIRKPVEKQGRTLQPGLEERLLADVRDKSGRLPLLEFALTKMWQEQNEAHELTHTAFEKIGGAAGALSQHANEVLEKEELSDPIRQEQARRLFIQLVQPGQGTDHTRRLATKDEIGNANWALAQWLAGEEARLVVMGDVADQETVELVHEALIDNWDRLHDWIKADRDFRAWQEQLRFAMRQWVENNKDEGALLRGKPLAVAEGWLKERPEEIAEPEQKFVEASWAAVEAAKQREFEAERRHVKRLRWLVAGLVVMVLVSIGAAAIAAEQRQAALQAQATAEAESHMSRSRELAAAAVASLEQDPELSILLAMQAMSETYTAEAENALRLAVQTSRLESSFSDQHSQVYGVAFNPDGARLAIVGDGEDIVVYDTTSKRIVMRISDHTDVVYSVVYSPKGKYLATASRDGTAKIWNAVSGQEVMSLRIESPVLELSFDQTETKLATASADGIARVWDISTGQVALIIEAHDATIYGLAFSRDGARLATASADATAKVWDTVTGQEIFTFEHSESVYGVAFSPDGSRLATAGQDQTVTVWNTEDGQPLQVLRGHDNTIYRVSFSSDGKRLATASFDRTARIWDATTGRPLLTLSGHTDIITGLSYSQDSTHLATGSFDGTAKIWTVATHNDPIMDLAFSPDGSRLATASEDKTVKLWNAETGQQLRTLSGHNDRVFEVTFSPNGTMLATASADKRAIIWNTTTGTSIQSLKHPAPVNGVAFSPDENHLATASYDHLARVWDVKTGRELLTLSGHKDELQGVAFDPTGKLVVTVGTDKLAIVWNANTGQRLLTLKGHTNWVNSAAFSPQGKYLATVSDEAIIWDVETGQKVISLTGHTKRIFDVTFNQDGTYIATGGEDKTARIWDAKSGQELMTFLGNNGPVYSVAFSPDGKRLAGAGADGMIHLNPLTTQELQSLAKKHLTRWWRVEECQKYLYLKKCPRPPKSDEFRD